MNRVLHFLRSAVLEVVLVVLCIVLACVSEGFRTTGNALNVLYNISIPGIIALGMTMVIISGEIDLSVGSAVAWSGCWTAWLVQFLSAHHVAMPVAILVAGVTAVVTGALVGLIFLGVVLNGMILLDFPEYWQGIVKGGLILAASLLNATQSKEK